MEEQQAMSGFKVVLGLCIFVLAPTLFSQSSFAEKNPAARTNLLWISIDDQSPWYGTYGDTRIQTPNIDACAYKAFDRSQMCGGVFASQHVLACAEVEAAHPHK